MQVTGNALCIHYMMIDVHISNFIINDVHYILYLYMKQSKTKETIAKVCSIFEYKIFLSHYNIKDSDWQKWNYKREKIKMTQKSVAVYSAAKVPQK